MRYQIQGYTKALLTISNTFNITPEIDGYVDEVGICHLSLLEYLQEDNKRTRLENFCPDLNQTEILARLKLAELSLSDLGN